MQGFIDETRVEVYSGDGGAGSVLLPQRKIRPLKAGPTAVTAGAEGTFVFQVKTNLKNPLPSQSQTCL